MANIITMKQNNCNMSDVCQLCRQPRTHFCYQPNCLFVYFCNIWSFKTLKSNENSLLYCLGVPKTQFHRDRKWFNPTFLAFLCIEVARNAVLGTYEKVTVRIFEQPQDTYTSIDLVGLGDSNTPRSIMVGKDLLKMVVIFSSFARLNRNRPAVAANCFGRSFVSRYITRTPRSWYDLHYSWPPNRDYYSTIQHYSWSISQLWYVFIVLNLSQYYHW